MSFLIFAVDMAHNKRDSAAAGLPWPGHAARANESDEEDMSIPAFTNPSESATPGETLPTAAYKLDTVIPQFINQHPPLHFQHHFITT